MNTPPPKVTAVDPARGPLAGGTTVAITGTGFVAGATRRFGSTAATGVTFESATSLSAVASAGTGSVGVTLTNPDNDTSTLSSASKYAAAPTVTSATPSKVTTAGGAKPTMAGTGFEAGATVTVGGVEATEVEVVSASQIKAVAPAGAAGTLAIVVTNLALQFGTLASAVTYVQAPRVDAISPDAGAPSATTLVTITGTGFGEGTTVRFGDAKATNVILVNAQTLTEPVPAGGKGTVPVTVSDVDGLSGGSNATSPSTRARRRRSPRASRSARCPRRASGSSRSAAARARSSRRRPRPPAARGSCRRSSPRWTGSSSCSSRRRPRS
ncbi:MAG: hypothetical protein FJZ92_12805 [Chloroflexi bacterium]|nr:hypothetical protein [Chloroflexota bacterium]